MLSAVPLALLEAWALVKDLPGWRVPGLAGVLGEETVARIQARQRAFLPRTSPLHGACAMQFDCNGRAWVSIGLFGGDPD